MRLGLLALGLLLLAPLAAAQQEGALVLYGSVPDHALVPGEKVHVDGYAVLTVDPTAYTSVAGIPVTYTVTKSPAWASVVVSPTSDLFVANQPMPGTAITIARPVSVEITLASDLANANRTGLVRIAATTTPAPGGKVISGVLDVPLLVRDPAPCTSALRAQAADVKLLGASWDAPLALAGLGVGLVVGARRPRVGAALAVLVVAGLAAPMAAAQQQGGITVLVTPPGTAQVNNVTTTVGRVTLTADLSAYSSPTGIPVVYTVSKAPAWASVAISPSNDLFASQPMPGTVMSISRPISIVILADSLPANVDLTDVIEITAQSMPTFAGKALIGKAAVPIHAVGPSCATASASSEPVVKTTSVAPAKAPSSSPPLTVQSNEAMLPTTGFALVGGFAVAGAGVGLLLARRKP